MSCLLVSVQQIMSDFYMERSLAVKYKKFSLGAFWDVLSYETAMGECNSKMAAILSRAKINVKTRKQISG